MVVEELVEGGLTRLAVFFYQDIPDRVGPVRSMRATDIGIVKPVNAADRQRWCRADRAPTRGRQDPDRDRGRDRIQPRQQPRRAVQPLHGAADQADTGPALAPPHAYLPFGPADRPRGRPVKSITAQFSGGHTTSWSGGGAVDPDTNAAGDDFIADNVLLLRVKVGDAGYRDPAGNPVPETEFVGKGEGVLVHGGKAKSIVWSKKIKGGRCTCAPKAGKNVKVPAGNTWIELVRGGYGQRHALTRACRRTRGATGPSRAAGRDAPSGPTVAMTGCRAVQHLVLDHRPSRSCPPAAPRSAS